MWKVPIVPVLVLRRGAVVRWATMASMALRHWIMPTLFVPLPRFSNREGYVGSSDSSGWMLVFVWFLGG
jgi:hypothetical protein